MVARDVNLVHTLMRDEICAHISAPIRKSDEPRSYHWRENLFEEFAQVIVDGIHLEKTYHAFAEKLVQHIERRDAGDVAGSQYQANFASRRMNLIEGCGVLREIFRSYAGLHPHLRRVSAQQQPV